MQSYPLGLTVEKPSDCIFADADLFVYESAVVVPRINYLPFSNHPENNAWSKVGATVTTNASLDPEGNMTAAKLVEDNTINDTHVLQLTVNGLTAGYWTYSRYAKKAERTRIALGTWDGVTGINCVFDLNTGTVAIEGAGSTARIESVPDAPDWYRCIITRSIAGNTLQVNTYLDNGSNIIYTGNGASGVYLWEAMLESGNVATPLVRNPGATPMSDKSGDTRILVKPDNGAEIILRPGQRFRLRGAASRWSIKSFDRYSTLTGALIIGSGEFDDANTLNTFKLDGTFTNQVKIVNTEYEPAPVRLDPEQVSGSYSGAFSDTSTGSSAAIQVFSSGANTNGAWVESAQIGIVQDSGAVNWQSVSLLAKASAPTGHTDGDVILFARSYSSGSVTQVNKDLPARIKIPAGKGLYINQVTNGGAPLFSTKSVLYTLLP